MSGEEGIKKNYYSPDLYYNNSNSQSPENHFFNKEKISKNQKTQQRKRSPNEKDLNDDYFFRK